MHTGPGCVNCYVHTCVLLSSSCAFTFPHCVHHGHAFGACHRHMPQPVITCVSVVVQLVTSVDGEFDGGI